MAMIIPISTNTTIAACSQIQVGDIDRWSLPPAGYSALRNSAVTVSKTIFKSRPSDQWAM
jgi:hypothetical protein